MHLYERLCVRISQINTLQTQTHDRMCGPELVAGLSSIPIWRPRTRRILFWAPNVWEYSSIPNSWGLVGCLKSVASPQSLCPPSPSAVFTGHLAMHRRGAAKKEQGSKPAKKDVSDSDKYAELLVFGYSCKLFHDDEKALYHEQGHHLIPWMGDKSIMIDRSVDQT